MADYGGRAAPRSFKTSSGEFMAKNETVKEKCPRCQGTIHAKATDKSGKLYCQGKGCSHVWVPGAEAMKRPDVMIQKLQKENFELQEQIAKLRKQVADLQPNEKQPVSESEIFT